ncbi:hypothetical protein [Streptomyces sp. NPDC005251]|uniref:hypothetical protein n=1 Tax=unclassified Streptomyces TaxID=2593676 RepID=UPI0033A5581E
MGLVFAPLLAGCGSGRGPAPVRLVIWMYPVITDPQADTAYWGEVEKGFAKATPAVEVTVRHLPWAGRDQRIADAIAGDDGPDAVLLMPDQTPGSPPRANSSRWTRR